MAKKKLKKKMTKKSEQPHPMAYEIAYLTNVINRMDECATLNATNDLGPYFNRKAELNRERLKAIK